MAERMTRRGGRRSKASRGARLDGRTRAARVQGREAREELLTAALELFARRGYREASVDEIAAEAGYSKGALYWHFSDKEGLLMALLEERIDASTRDRIEMLASAPPERDKSVEAVRSAAHRGARGPAPGARVLEPRDSRSRASRPLLGTPD
jgi:AcrR family transcriptional regulator